MLTTLLHPLARMLLARVQSELDRVPHPVDAPQYHAPGRLQRELWSVQEAVAAVPVGG